MTKSTIKAETTWNLSILDANPIMGTGWCLGIGDVDGDGHDEVMIGGRHGMKWYRPATGESGIACQLENDYTFHVGLVMEDIDGDGRPEVVAGERGAKWGIVTLKPGPDINQPWERRYLATSTAKGAHDLCFADVDGDGVREMIANDIFPTPDQPGLTVFRPDPDNSEGEWIPHHVQFGCHEEGLVAADFDGDGRVEIASGTSLYRMPSEGPYSGLWEKAVYAPSFREMCRVRAYDITGNGKPDLIATDSEYEDGFLSWFENRNEPGETGNWVEHRLADRLIYSHSLDVWKDEDTGETCLFVGEMDQGGWCENYNNQARLLEFRTKNGGSDWQSSTIYVGAGTHEARVMPWNGAWAIVGKECWKVRVQLWTPGTEVHPLKQLSHRFLDKDKPSLTTDIMACDLDGDGVKEVVCGRWWYRHDTQERYQIPDITQAIAVADVDGDGREELIGTLPHPVGDDDYNRSHAQACRGALTWPRPDGDPEYTRLTSNLCWLKPVDPEKGVWETHPIGKGHGDWPHGSVFGSILPDGKKALVIAYHDAGSENTWPELFEVPEDPKTGPWKKRTLAEVPLREQMLAADLNGNGQLDLVSGNWVFENRGDGSFAVHSLCDPKEFEGTQIGVMDVNGNGRLDIVVGEQRFYTSEHRFKPFGKVAWFEQPEDWNQPWKRHDIDLMRCPHSLSVVDIDGDGELEIIAGEHDTKVPYRGQCRLSIYKKGNAAATVWQRFDVDRRFEHHCGTIAAELEPGKPVILSHGWVDTRYVHLWEMAPSAKA